MEKRHLKGVVVSFADNQGIIITDNAEKYVFNIADWESEKQPAPNNLVAFVEKESWTAGEVKLLQQNAYSASPRSQKNHNQKSHQNSSVQNLQDGEQSKNLDDAESAATQAFNQTKVQRDQRSQASWNTESNLFRYGLEGFSSSKVFQFQGRARPKEYWGLTLLQIPLIMFFGLVYVLIQALIGPALSHLSDGAVSDWCVALASLIKFLINAVSLFVFIGIIFPNLSCAVRRLHDTNRSGLWLLVALFLPIIGTAILIVFLAQNGTPGPNRYGDEIKPQSSQPN